VRMDRMRRGAEPRGRKQVDRGLALATANGGKEWRHAVDLDSVWSIVTNERSLFRNSNAALNSGPSCTVAEAMNLVCPGIIGRQLRVAMNLDVLVCARMEINGRR